LVGISSLLIACKLEEIYFPRIEEFETLADGKYTANDIFQIEIKILMSLKWLLNPTTMNAWANIFMLKWDHYVLENPLGLAIISS
jgi:cyclin E